MKTKKIIIIVIALVLVILSGFLICDKINYNKYLSGINSYLQDGELKQYNPTYELETENHSVVNVYLDSSFDEVDYNTQVNVILGITQNINNIYEDYRQKQFFNSADDNRVFIWVDKDSYRYEKQEESNSTILKNEKIYDEVEYLRERIISHIEADNEYTSYIYDISDKSALEGINAIDDIEQCKKEIIYTIANMYIQNNSDDLAKSILANLSGYRDSNQLLQNLNLKHEFDGEWYGTFEHFDAKNLKNVEIGYHWIFDGENCYNIYSDTKTQNGINHYYWVRKEDTLYLFKSKEQTNDLSKADHVFAFDNGTISCELYYQYQSYKILLKKISDENELPTTSYIKEPSIGMTAEQVKASTWGSPQKINKDTYSWGVREQWVYGNGKYIYFEDGVVTSISTSE